MIPDGYEEFEVIRRPEVVLAMLWLLRYYMQRQPGKARWALAYYAFTMARALLGLHGINSHWTAPDYMDDRLRHFGLEPETRSVKDPKRWAIAWKILNQHWASGAPWRINRETFNRDFDEAMRQPGEIEPAAPHCYTFLRAKDRPRRDSWRKLKKDNFYRPRTKPLFQTRIDRYLSELEEEF
jgi:hypothetical protein